MTPKSNSFGGMRDLAFSRGDIRDLAKNRGGKREFQLRVGTGICAFLGLRCEIGKGNRAGYGSFQRDFSISRPCSSRAQKPQAGGNKPFVRIAVSGFKCE